MASARAIVTVRGRSSIFFRRAMLLLGSLPLIAGCGFIGYPDGTVTTTSPSNGTLSGNWQFTATGGNGQTFSALAGYIGVASSGSSGTLNATAILQATPGSCYEGATLLPFSGYLANTNLTLNSFSVNGQYLDMNLTANSAATQLSGTYQVSGGCGNGAAGNLTGVHYAPVTGKYATQGSAQGLTLMLTQASTPDGDGGSPLSGTATVSGISCFSTGTVQSSGSYVLGSAYVLTLSAQDGATLTVQGTFDAGATALAVTGAVLTGDSCAGNLTLTTLAKS